MAPDTAKNGRRHSCYFLNREYEYGVLYDFLKDLRPGLLIVGLDFGAAETQAYKCSLSQTGATVFEKLKLSSNSNTIPTFICYRDGQAFIGPAARNDPNLIENFKVPPKYWGEPCSTSRNYGQVVGDYIAELWKNARRFDELLSSAAEGGDVLLVVGCPASPDWTGTEEMRRFAELVRAATGCANVAILPESNAAMMNAACSDAAGSGGAPDRPLDIMGGILIYDAGSSTIDVTYVLMGRLMLIMSLETGGHDLDTAIRRRALLDNGLTGGESVKSTSQVAVRFSKESFYVGGCQEMDPPPIVLSDGRRCPYVLNGGFMEEAVWHTPISYADGTEGVCWGERVREFVAGSMERVRKRSGPPGVRRVILTGGTSYVTQFRQIVRDLAAELLGLGPDDVETDQDPSAAVAKGLCKMYLRMSQAAGEINASLSGVIKPLVSREGDKFLRGLSESVYVRAMDRAYERLLPMLCDNLPHSRLAILRAAEEAIEDDPGAGVAFEKTLRDSFRAHSSVIRYETIVQLNSLTQKLYGARLTEDLPLPELEFELPEGFLSGISYNGHLRSSLGHSAMSSSIYAGVVALVTVGTLGLGPLIFGEEFDNMRYSHECEDGELSSAKCSKILSNLRGLRDGKWYSRWDRLRGAPRRKQAIQEIENQLDGDSSPMGHTLLGSFYQSMFEIFERALGCILLLIFEDAGEERIASSTNR